MSKDRCTICKDHIKVLKSKGEQQLRDKGFIICWLCGDALEAYAKVTEEQCVVIPFPQPRPC